MWESLTIARRAAREIVKNLEPVIESKTASVDHVGISYRKIFIILYSSCSDAECMFWKVVR